jgi:16S rRNA (cytosine967-C5)-methyltransferase
MRIHRPLAEAAAGILREVFDRGEVLDRVVAEAFRKNPRWGKRDRHFIGDSVWEVVRWRRALSFVADSDDVGALLAALWRRRGFEVPDWWDWIGCSLDAMALREGELTSQSRAVRESVPDWMDQRGTEELGDQWASILTALNQRAAVFLRANTLKTSRSGLLDILKGEGIEAEVVDGLPDGVRLAGMLPRKLVQDGRMEIQDGGSQMVAPMLQVEPGMRVIDACAGAGGKTLHLAALMQGKGEVLALDVNARKLKQLLERAKQAGVRNLNVARWDSSTLRRYSGWADRVLIDAPCSGLGTLRRQPDLKWRLDQAGFSKVRRTQRKLLDHYPGLLKPGGVFVYATCSVFPSENQGQIENLLHRDRRWILQESRTISPANCDFDGFYVARCGGSES